MKAIGDQARAMDLPSGANPRLGSSPPCAVYEHQFVQAERPSATHVVERSSTMLIWGRGRADGYGDAGTVKEAEMETNVDHIVVDPPRTRWARRRKGTKRAA